VLYREIITVCSEIHIEHINTLCGQNVELLNVKVSGMYNNTGLFSGKKLKGGYTLVTLPRIVTPYRDSVDGTRARVTYQKLVTR